jgi:hypothetical protein
VTADLIEGYLDQLITHLRCSATDVWNDCENDHLTVLGAWLTVVAMLERRRSASEYRCMNAVARRPAIQQERERLQARWVPAAELFAIGVRQAEIAHQLGVSRQAVNLWHAARQAGGAGALRSRGPTGPTPRPIRCR